MKARSVIMLVMFAVNLTAAEPMEPPMPPSPIAEFRRWLESPEERKVALAKRSPEKRQQLENKINEYIALQPIERERRLSATELQWYVTQIISLPKSKRDEGLRQVSIIWQPMVMERLSTWDKMPPDLQSEARQHRLAMEYVSAPANKQDAVLKTLPPTERVALMQRVAQWKILPAVERERLDERLGAFFKMRMEQQQQTLNNFSDDERKSMEAALASFRTLTPEQREVCIRSFMKLADKFAAMDQTQRIAFLKNAERWQEMPQKDRDMWRQIVAIVPPMPAAPLPNPPLPPQLPPTPPNTGSSAKSP
jgi:hypothetical protein